VAEARNSHESSQRLQRRYDCHIFEKRSYVIEFLSPELVFNYMNGPRTLSNDHLSYLIFSAPTCPPEADPTEDTDYGIYDVVNSFLRRRQCALHIRPRSSLHFLTSTKNDEELKKSWMSLEIGEQSVRYSL